MKKLQIKYGEIRLAKDGTWYHEGVEVTHERTIELFNRSILRDKDGKYWLMVGNERARIVVEDAPYRVISIDGDPMTGVTVGLSDRTVEDLKLDTLRIGKDRAFYATVKKGGFPARFTRSSHHYLAKWVEYEKGVYFIRSGEGRHIIEEVGE